MKKIFTLLITLLLANSLSAAVMIDGFEAKVKENGGNTFSYNGTWAGNWFDQGENNYDATSYDYVWIKYSGATGAINFSVVYNEWQKTESWGEVYETVGKAIEGEAGVIGIQLEKTKTYSKSVGGADSPYLGDVYAKHIRQISLQDQGAASSITVEGIWYGTEAEYQAALAGNVPEKPQTSELLSRFNGTDNADGTKTITFTKSWDWISTWYGGYDASYYDFLVVELAEPAEIVVQALVKHTNGAAEVSGQIQPGDLILKLALSEEGKSSIEQIALQNDKEGTAVFKTIYFATKAYVDNMDDPKPVVPKVDKELSLTDLGSGWGESAYDAETKTITIGEDWSGKGWWFGEKDASEYNYLVVKFEEATELNGKVVVQNNNESASGDDGLFDAKCLQKIVKLPAGCDHLQQVYIQGPAGAKYKLASVYFATQAEVDANGIKDEYMSTGTSKTWNFSEWELGDITETKTIDGLTVAATSDKKVTIDGNSKTFEDVKYTQRLKLGGTGSGPETKTPSRYLSFQVTGDCNIKVFFAHASSSGDDRTLNLATGEYSSIAATQSLAAGETATLSYDYKGGETTVYLYSANSGLNLYAIIVTAGTSSVNSIEVEKAKNNIRYNLAGQRVDESYKGVVIMNGKKFVVK